MTTEQTTRAGYVYCAHELCFACNPTGADLVVGAGPTSTS